MENLICWLAFAAFLIGFSAFIYKLYKDVVKWGKK